MEQDRMAKSQLFNAVVEEMQKREAMYTKAYETILNNLLDALEKNKMPDEKNQVEFCSIHLQKVEEKLTSMLQRLEELQEQMPKEEQIQDMIQKKVAEAVRELKAARRDTKDIKQDFQASVKRTAREYKNATALKLRQVVGELKIPEKLEKIKEILNKAEDRMRTIGEWIGIMRGRRQAAAIHRLNAKRALRGEPPLDPNTVVPETHKGLLASLQKFFWSAEKELEKTALQCEGLAGKFREAASEKKLKTEEKRMKRQTV